MSDGNTALGKHRRGVLCVLAGGDHATTANTTVVGIE